MENEDLVSSSDNDNGFIKAQLNKELDYLKEEYKDWVEKNFRGRLSPEHPTFKQVLDWAKGRFEYGHALARLLSQRFPNRAIKILDLGSGNGGVSFPLAKIYSHIFAFDYVCNSEVTDLIELFHIPLKYIVGDAHSLPFKKNSFDVVLFLDVVEHVLSPQKVAGEIIRILNGGGLCILTTPPRLSFVLKPDPHYSIPFLVNFPRFIQKYLATKIFKRTDNYEVYRMFWSLKGINKLFCHYPIKFEVFPANSGFLVKNFFWDTILITKM